MKTSEIKNEVIVEKAYQVANRWAQSQCRIDFCPIIEKDSAQVQVVNPEQSKFSGFVSFKYGEGEHRFSVEFSKTPSHRLLFTSFAVKYATGCNFYEVQA